MNRYIYLTSLLVLFSCSTSKQIVKTNLIDHQTFELLEISDDPTYGYSEKNPIQVGGVDNQSGPLNERRFLNALAGPNGEEVVYFRSGSCCPIKSKNDPLGFGQVMLDNYRLAWKGSNDTVSIYINMYDYGSLKAPKGFTIKKLNISK
ncbi:2-dehydro-3-deoxyphosphooctonate aldolase [Marnyiella aurantia]|uniref:2-dehydro-3-deoxyphosphooctonate aldolase n=1 Tax=Marnyiella aurantia TaxID=2758037 RepID=UPI001E3F8C46|nr:2-dehydro-3-deoxyphosphooctonate aldolase [Marnyiella aurantia]